MSRISCISNCQSLPGLQRFIRRRLAAAQHCRPSELWQAPKLTLISVMSCSTDPTRPDRYYRPYRPRCRPGRGVAHRLRWTRLPRHPRTKPASINSGATTSSAFRGPRVDRKLGQKRSQGFQLDVELFCDTGISVHFSDWKSLIGNE